MGLPVDATDAQGWTPLHFAVLFGREDAARLLLDEGAPVNAHERGSHTPLGLAAAHAEEGLAVLLLARGADPNQPDAEGLTPLHLASRSDRIGLWLLGEDNETLAQEKLARVAVVRRLLAAGADKSARDADGRTPYDVAVQDGEPEVAKLLGP